MLRLSGGCEFDRGLLLQAKMFQRFWRTPTQVLTDCPAGSPCPQGLQFPLARTSLARSSELHGWNTPISICGAKAPQQYPYCGGSLHESGQPGVDAIADPHALQRPSIEKSSWEILPQQFTVRLGTCVNAPRVPQSLLGAKRIQNIAREPFGVNRKGHFPQ